MQWRSSEYYFKFSEYLGDMHSATEYVHTKMTFRADDSISNKFYHHNKFYVNKYGKWDELAHR